MRYLSKEQNTNRRFRAVSQKRKGEPGSLIIKIGGSLFSDKCQNRVVDEGAIAGYARLVGDLWKTAPGCVVFISGGGSFGHPVARALDPADPHASLALTEANFVLKWIWTTALRKEGAPALPFQLTGICSFDGEQLQVQGGALRRALDIGALPVLSGDCLISRDCSLRILPSDRLPEIFMSLLPTPIRIVSLTNVAGILTDGPNGSSVLRCVDATAPQSAYQFLWAAPDWDMSQAMFGKLDAMIQFARLGAECLILKGNPDAANVRFLLKPVGQWPPETTYTRIALPDALMI